MSCPYFFVTFFLPYFSRPFFARNPVCVSIGRMSIKHAEFGNTMRPNTWVGSFAMNVYCEALAYDQSKEANPKIKKGFLTSAEVVS